MTQEIMNLIEKNNITDIHFCPRDFRECKVEDCIDDAHAMLTDYDNGQYEDISDMLL